MKFSIACISACVLTAAALTPLAAGAQAKASKDIALPLGAKGPTGYGPSGQLLYLISKDLITRAEAQRLVQTAVDDCAKRGVPGSAMVIDANGAERAELSDDMTPLQGLITTRQKAEAVLAFKASTSSLMDRVKTDKAFADKYGKDKRYFFMGGGLPIYKGGKFVAVLAVGGTHNQDEACALDALKTVAWARTGPSGK